MKPLVGGAHGKSARVALGVSACAVLGRAAVCRAHCKWPVLAGPSGAHRNPFGGQELAWRLQEGPHTVRLGRGCSRRGLGRLRRRHGR